MLHSKSGVIVVDKWCFHVYSDWICAGGRVIPPAWSVRAVLFSCYVKSKSGRQRTQDCVTWEKEATSGVFWKRKAKTSPPLFPSSLIHFSGYNGAYWMCDVRVISVSELFMLKIRGEFLLQWNIRDVEGVNGTCSHSRLSAPFPEKFWHISWCWFEICERYSGQ